MRYNVNVKKERIKEMKAYKEIIKKMAEMKTESEYNQVCSMISNAFNKDKISWEDYETLNELAAKASVTVL